MTAQVSLPKRGLEEVQVQEGERRFWGAGKQTSRVPGLAAVAEHDDRVTLQVGSGSYRFQLSVYERPLQTPDQEARAARYARCTGNS